MKILGTNVMRCIKQRTARSSLPLNASFWNRKLGKQGGY